MDFYIDEQYLCSVNVIKEWSMYEGKSHADLTPEQLVKVIQGRDICKSHSTIDHPEFTKLRDSLEEQGYIKTERRWWNGDRVLKPFTLNGFSFKKNNQFSCAIAMGISFKIAKQHNRKTID